MKRFLALILSFMFLCSCGESVVSGNQDDGLQNENTEFGVSIVPEAQINPYVTKSKENLEIFNLIYEGLFDIDENFMDIAILCDQYTKKDNVYRITIKNNIQFSDGSYLTAADVAYSLTLAKGENSYFSTRLANVVSATASGNEVEITLLNPNARLSNLLDVPIIKRGSEQSAIAIGTGPYALSYNADTKEYLLIKNQYWRNKDTLPFETIKVVSVQGVDQLTWGFESMNIDIITFDPTGVNPYQFRGDYQYTDVSTTSLVYLGFNHNIGIFQNANIRRAVSCAIDRQGAVEQDFALMGHPTTIPLHPLCRAYNKDVANTIDYSKENAMANFNAAGFYDSDGDGKLDNSYRSYTILVNSENKSRVALARRVAETLTNMGFTVNVREEKWEAYKRALLNGDFDMYIAEVNMRADFNLDALLRSGAALNYGDYSSSETDNRLRAYNTLKLDTSDEMSDFILHLTEVCPIAPILFKKHSIVTHDDFFTKITPTAHNTYYKFNSWKVVE